MGHRCLCSSATTAIPNTALQLDALNKKYKNTNVLNAKIQNYKTPNTNKIQLHCNSMYTTVNCILVLVHLDILCSIQSASILSQIENDTKYRIENANTKLQNPHQWQCKPVKCKESAYIHSPIILVPHMKLT